MRHPMDYYGHGESMESRTYARYERVLEALKNVPLSEFTVGQLRDIHRLVAREWDLFEVLERLEALAQERSRAFRHGAFVRYKKGPKGKAIITSHPRRGTRLVHVKGPRGWSGWANIDELEVVPP